MNALLAATGLTAVLIGGGSPAPDHPTPTVRADIAASIGWNSVASEWDRSRTGRHRWQSITADVEGGWYWTDHLETALELGVDGRMREFHSEQVDIDGRLAYQTGTSVRTRRRVAVSQLWQFRRNAWFHPYAGAGFAITAVRATEFFDPIVEYRGGSSPGRILRPARTEGPRTEWRLAPIVTGGFKAYLTPRAFFRSDVRGTLRHGIDEMTARIGFGVDF